MKLESFKKKYHLYLIGLSFLILGIIIASDTYNYFINKKFFEGYIVAFQIIVFDFINLILIVPFLIKKDFINLLKASIFFIIITVISFFGFKLPLILIPLISFCAALYFLKKISEFKKVY